MELHHADDHYKKLEDQFHIRVVTPKRARDALKNYVAYADTSHSSVQHLAFIGDAGVGKTAIVKEAAREFDLQLIVLRLAEMSDGELLGFPFQVEGRPGVVRMCLVADYADQIEEAVAKGKRLMVFFDEVNRAKRSHINALFNLLDTKTWAGTKLPQNTLFVAAMNPPTEAYTVTELDMALMRRFMLLGIRPSSTEVVEYLKSTKGCDEGVVAFMEDNPDKILGLGHLNAGKKFNCPASFESIGRMVAKAMDSGLPREQIAHSLADLIVASGNAAVGDDIVTYLRKRTDTVAPTQILSGYSQVRDRFLALEAAHATIIVQQFAKVLGDAKEEIEEDSDRASNIASFLADLDERLMQVFVDMFHGTLGSHGVSYSRQLMRTLRTGERTSEDYFRAMTMIKEAEERIAGITNI